MNMDKLIMLSVKHNASDLHLCVDKVPALRIEGELYPQTQLEKLKSSTLEQFLDVYLDEKAYHEFTSLGHVDLAIIILKKRLRVNIFRDNNGISAVIRLINDTIPTLASIDAPEILTRLIAETESGLILVTGATGSGKSSTLAGMIEHLNQHCAKHIITLEDPIEFIYSNQQCLIRQRQIGRDAPDYAQALHGILRQDPDVIILGELRDEISIRLALNAAETGHLVLSTLHTRNAVASIERLMSVFSADEKPWISSQLADNLRAIIAQKLIKCGTGRKALFEVLVMIPAISHLIRENRLHQIETLLQTGSVHGMMTFDQCYRWRQEQ